MRPTGERRDERNVSRGVDRTTVARSFTVEDDKGNKRAELTLNEGSCPGLWLFDEKGNARAGLTVLGDQPDLSLRDADGRALVQIRAEDPHSRISLFDVHGEQWLSLTTTNEGSWIHLRNGKTTRRIDLYLPLSGDAYFYMGDLDGPSLKLKADHEGPSLLLGKQNNTIWSAP